MILMIKGQNSGLNNLKNYIFEKADLNTGIKFHYISTDPGYHTSYVFRKGDKNECND